MGFALLTLVVWLPLLVVPAVLSARAIWVSLTRPKGYHADPSCERCRYKVKGLSTFTCPECGTDLRRTGIITPTMEMKRRGSMAAALVGWTMLLLLGSIFVSTFVMYFSAQRMMPVMVAGTAAGPMTMSTPLTSSTNLYKDVTIVTDFGGVNAATVFDVVLTDNAGNAWTMKVDVPKETSTISDSGGNEVYTGGAGEEADVKALLAAAKIDASDKLVQAEVKDLTKMLVAVSMGGYVPQGTALKSLSVGGPAYGQAGVKAASGGVTTTSGGGSTMVTATGSGTVVAATTMPASPFDGYGYWLTVGYGLVAVVWLVGVVLIVLRRKGLMREVVRVEREAVPAGPPDGGGVVPG